MKILASSAGFLLLLLASCASTPKVSDSWRNSEVRDFKAAKTVVVVMSGETNYRRVVEDELVHQLGASSSGPSYPFLDAAELADPKQSAQLARDQGFDSALVVRILGIDEVEQRVPGAYTPVYVTFSGQSFSTAYLWPTSANEGYSYIEKTFRLETSLYALGDDKLVWSGVVVIRDPETSRELAKLNGEAVLAELRAQKLLR